MALVGKSMEAKTAGELEGILGFLSARYEPAYTKKLSYFFDTQVSEDFIFELSGESFTLMRYCLAADLMDAFKLLLDRGFHLCQANHDLLGLACRRGLVEYVELLVAHEADVNYVDDANRTALIHALIGTGIVQDKIAIVRLLLDHNADVSHRQFGRTVTEMVEKLSIEGEVRDFFRSYHDEKRLQGEIGQEKIEMTEAMEF